MKKTSFISCYLLLTTQILFSQSVGIGINTPHASAQLDIANSSKGVLIPRMTTANISSIISPAKGLMVYDSTINQLMVNRGSVIIPNWQPVASGNTLTNVWNLSGNTGTDPSTNFIGTTDNTPLQFRINNILAGSIDSLTQSTFLGFRAGYGINNNSNTALGYKSLYSNNGGSNNAAVGAYSLAANSTGYGNAAFGDYTLKSNTIGTRNSAVGYEALYSNVSGYDNSALGYATLFFNTTGSHNSALGYEALFSNSTGVQNVAMGYSALYANSTGRYNSATGVAALQSNTTADYNTAHGHSALRANTTGTYNTATGVAALYYNTTGNYNSAVGLHALFTNATGSYNSAMGIRSLFNNSTGYYNVGVGDAALYSNSTGVGNTSIGSGSLYLTTGSSYNTTVGYHAGYTNNLGWNNTLIGAECNATASGIYNSIALGNGVSISASNQARVGNFSTASIGGYQDWTHFSDGRFKKNIQEDVKGLDFIMKLRPVTYQLDIFNLDKKLNKEANKTSNENMLAAMKEKEQMIQTGFIAQEVEQAAKSLDYDFSAVDKPKNENDFYGLRYAQFVVPLVKAVQEQQQMINELKESHEALQKENIDQKKRNTDLMRRIKKLESQFLAASDLQN